MNKKSPLVNLIVGVIFFSIFILGFFYVSGLEYRESSDEELENSIKFEYGENNNILLNYDITINPQNENKVILEYYIPQDSYRQKILDNNIRIIPTGPYSYDEYNQFYNHNIEKNDVGNKVGIIEVKNTEYPVEVNVDYLVKSKQVEDFKIGQEINENEINKNEKWINSSPFINAYHEEIGQFSNQIMGNNNFSKLEKTQEFYYHLQDKYDGTFPTLDETGQISSFIGQDEGHCENIAALHVALNRNNDIPSRVVVGTVGEGDYFLFHAWTEKLTEYGWIESDPTYTTPSTYDFGNINDDFIKIYHRPDAFVDEYFSRNLPYNTNSKEYQDIAGRHYVIYYGWNSLRPEIEQNITTEFVEMDKL